MAGWMSCDEKPGGGTPGGNERSQNMEQATLFTQSGEGKEKPRDLPAGVRWLVDLPLAPPTRRNHPDTSRAAGRSMVDPAKRLRGELMTAFIKAGAAGLTDAEAEAATGMAGNSLRPRRGELERLGLIELTTLRRPTPAGRSARVYRSRVAASGVGMDGGVA